MFASYLKRQFSTTSIRMTAEQKKLCLDSINKIMVGIEENNVQNGRDFYKYFFTNFPDLRVYFKGAEKFTADDVQKSERFAKQGQRILLAVHVCANTWSNPEVFKGYARETVNRHRQFKMTPDLWLAFWTVWVGFMESKIGTMDQATKDAWAQMGKEWNAECQAHLKNTGLPHC